MTELLDTHTEEEISNSEFQDEITPIRAHLSYVNRRTVRSVSYAFEPPEGVPWENCDFDLKRVAIHDARLEKNCPKLDKQGYELFGSYSRVSNFYDDDEVRSSYYPEMIEIALLSTGGKAAYIFDHLVRRKDPNCSAMSFGRRCASNVPSANGRIHNDYTEESGKRRFEIVFPNSLDRSLIQRYSIVNIWRSIKSSPILDTPLAVCDARTVSSGDIVPADVIYPTRSGEVYLLTYSPSHRWSYFSQMKKHEVIVFKQYDSQLSGTSRFTPHSAFDHPFCPRGVSPRESIEVRCLVVY